MKNKHRHSHKYPYPNIYMYVYTYIHIHIHIMGNKNANKTNKHRYNKKPRTKKTRKMVKKGGIHMDLVNIRSKSSWDILNGKPINYINKITDEMQKYKEIINVTRDLLILLNWGFTLLNLCDISNSGSNSANISVKRKANDLFSEMYKHSIVPRIIQFSGITYLKNIVNLVHSYSGVNRTGFFLDNFDYCRTTYSFKMKLVATILDYMTSDEMTSLKINKEIVENFIKKYDSNKLKKIGIDIDIGYWSIFMYGHVSLLHIIATGNPFYSISSGTYGKYLSNTPVSVMLPKKYIETVANGLVKYGDDLLQYKIPYKYIGVSPQGNGVYTPDVAYLSLSTHICKRLLKVNYLYYYNYYNNFGISDQDPSNSIISMEKLTEGKKIQDFYKILINKCGEENIKGILFDVDEGGYKMTHNNTPLTTSDILKGTVVNELNNDDKTIPTATEIPMSRDGDF